MCVWSLDIINLKYCFFFNISLFFSSLRYFESFVFQFRVSFFYLKEFKCLSIIIFFIHWVFILNISVWFHISITMWKKFALPCLIWILGVHAFTFQYFWIILRSSFWFSSQAFHPPDFFRLQYQNVFVFCLWTHYCLLSSCFFYFYFLLAFVKNADFSLLEAFIFERRLSSQCIRVCSEGCSGWVW